MRRFYALLLAALLLSAGAVHAAVYALPWGPKPQFVDANGAPMSGGTLTFYAAGTTTLTNTYTSSTGAVANANPVTLNSRGEPANEIWLTAGTSYKLLLKDSSGSTIWTVDNITGVNDSTLVVTEWVAASTPTYISATSFSVAGDQTTAFHVGRRLKSTNGGGTIYSTITASSYAASVTTVTVSNDSGSLDASLSAMSYGIVSFANTSAPDGKRAATYRWTDWDPSDVVGTLTNASSSAASSVTATNFLTMANSSGTLTLTFTKPGNYLIGITVGNECAAAATAMQIKLTFGGTATRHLSASATYPFALSACSSVHQSASVSFMVVATVNQTLTVLPQVAVTSGGGTTSFTTDAALTAHYTGN